MFFRHNPSENAELIARAVLTACRSSEGWPSPCCQPWLQTILEGLLGFTADVDALHPIAPAAVRHMLRSGEERLELIELMLSLAMLCNPIPESLQASIEHWSSCLDVTSEASLLVRDLVANQPQRATADWFRLSWWGQRIGQEPERMALLARHGVMAYALTVEADPAEAERWRALQHCPAGSLGRSLHQRLTNQRLTIPGEVGSTGAILALHDWVHLITNLPGTPPGEIATAAYIAAASGTDATTTAFLGTISVFEASLLNYHSDMNDPGHASRHPHFQGALSTPGQMQRVVRAIRHGLICPIDPVNGIDYFAMAHKPLAAIRQRWQLPEQGL